MAFTIFIVGKSQYENHIGEDFDFIHEVPDQLCYDSLPEHTLLLRGVIRSAWYDFSKEISIVMDCDPSWNVLIDDLRITMKEEEGIEF